MISTPERRQGENARIPCAILVELTPDSRGPGFEADAVDMSAGGLSLRASSLPEVGAMLNCRFETLPGGTRISGRGEVVWAKLSGERSGEFGLRFTEIEPEAQALLAEMIAERVANAGGSPAPQNPRTATLEIEHAEQPITAKLTRAVGQDVVFEQPLDVLALGSSVVAHADKALGHGNILRVDLRMDGGTPTLALTVRFSQPQDERETFGEYDWGEQESGIQQVGGFGLVGEVDTVPDLAAPMGVVPEPEPEPEPEPVAMPALAAALSPHTTTIGYPRPNAGPHGRTVAGYALPVPTPVVGGEHEHEHEGPWAGDKDTEPDVLADMPRAAPEQLGLGLVNARPRAVPRPVPVLVRKPEEFPSARRFQFREDTASVEEYDAVGLPQEESSPGTYEPLQLSTSSAGDLPASQPGNVWADQDAGDNDWSQVQPEGSPSWSQSSPDGVWSPAGSSPSWSQSQARVSAPDGVQHPALVRFLRIFAGLWETLQPVLAALRRGFLRAQQVVLPSLRKRLVGSPMVKSTLRGVGARPRRSVGLPTVEQIPKWTRGTGRLLLLAVLMLGCGMLLVYAMAPAAPSDEIVSHRPLQLEEAEQTAENAATDPAQLAAPLEAAADSNTGSQLAAVAQNGRTQMAGPAARPKQAPPAPQLQAAATTFGAKNVPNAQRFLLRMSDPVKTLHGKADARGFVVQVPASRAIDRAAPIAVANKAVAKATILNKGTHAELNIRFAEGRSPAYRVSAQQAGLEVLISQ